MLLLPTLDGEYCRIYTKKNKVYTGTILCESCAIHVYPDANTRERNLQSLIVRVDENVNTKEDIKALGIENGNYIAIDAKTQILNNGFIKSRFLDNKINVACLLGLIKYIYDNKITVKNNLAFFFPNYEEVEHGCAYLPIDIDVLYALDIGCIGPESDSDEHMVNICSKDYYSPYDYQETNKLIQICKKNKINYNIDSYDYYGSDVCAAQIGGQDFAGVTFGPNVNATHGMERTHIDGIMNNFNLLIALIKQ